MNIETLIRRKVFTFIKSHEEEINSNKFEDLYKELDYEYKSFRTFSTFTEILLEANLNPTPYLTKIPQGFLGSSFNKSSFTVPEGVKYINPNAFHNTTGLKEINLPKSLKVIRAEAFSNSPDLRLINYNGTREEWEAIEKSSDWNEPPYIATVKCIDGDLHYYGYN